MGTILGKGFPQALVHTVHCTSAELDILNCEFVETIGNDLTNHDIVWIEFNICNIITYNSTVRVQSEYFLNSRDIGSGKSGRYDITMKYSFRNKLLINLNDHVKTKNLPEIFLFLVQKILNHIEIKSGLSLPIHVDFISKSMIKGDLLSQKKVNSRRIVTADLSFPLFTIYRSHYWKVFLKRTLAVHFGKKLFQCDICDYCYFQVDIKISTWKRNMEERNLIVFLKTHTSSSFWKEAVPMWHLWLLLLSSWY